MADELIDLLNERGEKMGRTVMKSEAHAKGLWHETAHVWLYNSEGEVLIQLRHAKYDGLDDLWDFSAGGHIVAGQSPEDAAVREVKEELGLNITKKLLKKVCDYKYLSQYSLPNGKSYDNKEYFRVFFYKLHSRPNFSLQESEVGAVKFIKLQTLESELKDAVLKKKYVGHGAYWFDMINLIKKQLD